jgi:hypothetical protein
MTFWLFFVLGGRPELEPTLNKSGIML